MEQSEGEIAIQQAKLHELLEKHPEYKEYDQIFQKMKESLSIEIQNTRNLLIEKMKVLNDAADSKFDELYNKCNARLRKAYQMQYSSTGTQNSINQTKKVTANDQKNLNDENDTESESDEHHKKSSDDDLDNILFGVPSDDCEEEFIE
ncbi:hypothetical protein TRFO_13760 [Tritrichomonas foetus]|uniref:Uncharacterized protein n=1 Tax=Tritrichomonas foetus TaxID=1144522 RepID=A0A1J4L1D7_9EUKA|nr:hypothetical protein TRFO_13760 [Tritrichomonas foetus]|eukprot:OHT15774.1 hypothetical protein TRFO_13760 [Tritrichomonas foetus]